jgi:Rrf2 family protein
MLVLAMNGKKGPLMTKSIAETQNLPLTYLEQLMLALRKSGLVAATRGAYGGYELARDVDAIFLSEIVEALDGPIELVDCSDTPSCVRDPQCCALKDVFENTNRVLSDSLRVSLGELATLERKKHGAETSMYYI